MKAFLSAVLVALTLYMPITALANEPTDSMEFIHSIQVGVANFSFHDCTPHCGGTDNFGVKKVVGVNETLYFKTGYKLEPGVQIGLIRTTAMHIHNPGEIDDQNLYSFLLVRMPLTNKVTGYAGAGIGTQFTSTVTSDDHHVDCNHPIYMGKIGGEYRVSKRVGVGLEYVYGKTSHKFGGEDGMVEKLFLTQRSQYLTTTVAFHF
jgi:hypothetical protein